MDIYIELAKMNSSKIQLKLKDTSIITKTLGGLSTDILSSNETHKTSDKKNESRQNFVCSLCGQSFTQSNNMYTHRKYRCKNRSQITEEHIEAQSTIANLSQPQSTPTTEAPNNVEQTELASQLRETQKQMTLMFQKQEEEKQKQETEKQRQEEERRKQEEDRRQLLEAIQTLSKTQGTQTNITINNNVTVFFNSSLNLYDKKKKLHGAQSAIEFLHQTLIEAQPSNKFSWILDRDIIGTSQCPLSINENGEFVVHTSEKEAKVCSLSQINQLGNASMSTSVMNAISDSIGIYTDRFTHATDEERDRTEDFFAPLHSGPFGHNILGNLLKYREINPTQKHVLDIAGGTKVKRSHH